MPNVTMFDPATGKVIDRDALRSLQVNAKGRTVPRSIIRDGKKMTETFDQNGRRDGFYTEHKSGRKDCTVQPESIKVNLKEPS